MRRPRAIPGLRTTAFYGGLAALIVAFLSPLAQLAHSLFSAHMVQHLVLMLVAAPLLAYGAGASMLRALPLRVRRSVLRGVRNSRSATRLLSNALVVGILHSVALWVWHLPRPYQAALQDEALHVVEHASFIVTALMFWSLVFRSARKHVALGPTELLVFAIALQSGALGAILTFATTVLYPLHAAGAISSGLTPLADQQLAGVIMWIPAGIVYFVTMAVLFLRWLRHVERRMAHADNRGSLRVRPGER